MTSTLIVTSVEKLQNRIVQEIQQTQDKPGIYVSLNKSQESTESMLIQNNINTDKLFFIDCVTSEKKRDDVLHISPNKLDLLTTAIEAFVNDIDQEKFLVIDAISTLLIYNNENKVAQFVKKVSEFGSNHNAKIVAFSPETKGEDLLNKIFNFFDEVKKE